MSGKRPTDHLEPSAKKRGNERQLTKDDASDDEEQVVDPGNFQRASEDVLKQRKIIKARRAADAGGATKANPFAGIQLAAGGAAPSANPFAGVSLTAPAALAPAAQPAPPQEKGSEAAEAAVPAAGDGQAAAATKQDKVARERHEENDKQSNDEAAAAAAPAAGGFGALASSGGLAFGKSGFGSAAGGFGSLASGTMPAFSFGAASSSAPVSSIFSFSTSTAAAGASSSPAAGTGAAPSLFGTTPATGTSVFGSTKPAQPLAELPSEENVTTGEEDEKTVFSGEGALFEFDAGKQWRERGRGEMRVNVAPNGRARLVMRQRGNLRLLLNASLWAEMQVTKMEGGKGATFACVNHAAAGEEAATGKKEGDEPNPKNEAAAAAAAPKLATYALRIKSPEVLEQFMAAVNASKALAKAEGEGGQ